MIPATKLPSTDFESRRKWILKNDHVCVLPFSVHHIQIEFDGQRDVTKQKTQLRNSCCCNLIFDSAVDSTDLSTFDLAADVKNLIVDGQGSPRCQRCKDSEVQTGTSERTMAMLSLPPDRLEAFVNNQSISEFTMRIKFSNLCNLACRSCSPSFSSKYAQVHKLQVPKELNKDIGQDEKNWEVITNNIKQYFDKYPTLNVNLLGGETLIQPGALKLLAWLKQQQLCNKINLGITTNLTTVDRDILDTLLQFKKLHVAASIDSVDNNYEYVRWPAVFDQVADNIDTVFVPLLQQGHHITVQPLINLNNIFYINDILDWWHNWFIQNNVKNIPVDPVMMFRPWHMTVQNLPLEYRPELASVLTQALTHDIWTGPHNKLKDYLTGMLDFAKSTTVIYDQFELYLFDTVKHDIANKTTMQNGNAKLFNMLNKQHLTLYQQFQNGGTDALLPTEQRKIYRNLPL